MNREPLEKLLEYCERSDDCQYGTLDTTLVRDLVNEALGASVHHPGCRDGECHPSCNAVTVTSATND